MKTKLFLIIISIGILFFASCKKESNEINKNEVYSAEQLNTVVESASVISTNVQSFMTTSLGVALDSGLSVNNPPVLTTSSRVIPGILKNIADNTYEWTGPDADGWYTRSYTAIYEYTEKVKYGDTAIYIRSMEYHGGDGSYSNVTTTKYIRYIKNDKVLYRGSSIWEVSAFGDNDISKSRWEIDFEDWNPLTNSGIYDWYWGVSENLGGNTVPLHRYENLIANEKGEMLHVKLTMYDDDGTETWSFEYDTPFVYVLMPEMPVN